MCLYDSVQTLTNITHLEENLIALHIRKLTLTKVKLTV